MPHRFWQFRSIRVKITDHARPRSPDLARPRSPDLASPRLRGDFPSWPYFELFDPCKSVLSVLSVVRVSIFKNAESFSTLRASMAAPDSAFTVSGTAHASLS